MSLLNFVDDLLDRTVLGGYDRFGYHLRKQLWAPTDLDVDLNGRTAVVTGANSGLGLVAARELVRRGARVHMVCRSEERGRTARDRVEQEANDAEPLRHGAETIRVGAALLELCDMGDTEQVRALADRIAGQGPVDILINNAGALLDERRETAAGTELTFAVGVLGYFALTESLLLALQQSANPRVINVSSGGMYPVGLNLDDLEWRERKFDGVRAYAEVKRAQVILTEIWSKRFAARNTNSNGNAEAPAPFFAAMHPGWADTPGVQTALPTFRAVTRLILRSPEEGADTIVWLAVAPGLDPGQSGRFWCDRRARPLHRLQSTRSSAADLKKFWDVCRAKTGIGPELAESFFSGMESSNS